jgi:hypothetical protein
MRKNDTLYAIYKYDFHRAERHASTDDKTDCLKNAQTYFAKLFDLKTIEKLGKENKKGEFIPLPNQVLKEWGDITMWQVNNNNMMNFWVCSGKDSQGLNRFEKQGKESYPYCYVLIDNRPGRCLMAIEKSPAWGGKPDSLRDILLENFNSQLSSRFGLEMRIEARMNPTDIWDFMHDRITHHNDYVRRVSFTFQDPDKVSRTNDTDVKSEYIQHLLSVPKAMDALQCTLSMIFDQTAGGKMLEYKKRDLGEVIKLCGANGYDLCITFAKYKTYRINDYVRACIYMDESVIKHFWEGQMCIDGESDLAKWFDKVDEETKLYCNESEVPRRRNRKNP